MTFATQLCPNRSQDLDISLNDVDQTNPYIALNYSPFEVSKQSLHTTQTIQTNPYLKSLVRHTPLSHTLEISGKDEEHKI